MPNEHRNGKMEVATIKGYHHKKKFDKDQIEICGWFYFIFVLLLV